MNISIKDQVTPEQWKALYNAISAASTYVSTASGGRFEMFKEAFSASKFMVETSQKTGGSGYDILVDEMLATMKGMMTFNDAKTDADQHQSKDIASLCAEAKQLVKEITDDFNRAAFVFMIHGTIPLHASPFLKEILVQIHFLNDLADSFICFTRKIKYRVHIIKKFDLFWQIERAGMGDQGKSYSKYVNHQISYRTRF
ncbi:MAG: hypothetical protein AB2L18_08590 [Anaerolineaceae bacterium]